MDTELLKYVIVVSMVLELIMVAIIASMQVKIYLYRRKIYFIKRDRERCNELLFTVKDGFFCFVYPDQKVKDSQKEIKEVCSRRLAVMLGMKNGTASSFNDISEAFYKEDARILKKYVLLLQQEGKAFEDMLNLKGNHRYMCVYGNRVNGMDNNLYCDVVWFRDVTAESAKISGLEDEKAMEQYKIKLLENMTDGLDYPLWLRDENLNLLAVNKKYLEYSGRQNREEVISQNVEIANNKGENISRKIAGDAQKRKKSQRKNINIVYNGQLHNFEVRENPYFIGDSLDKIGTVGYLVDNTELETLKRNFKLNQNSHLEILGTLGTAFAIFDNQMNLFFYNSAFRDLWGLETEFLDKAPNYLQFLEIVRERKILPPVPDFKAYKEDELSVFGGLLETKEDLLHLPDGRTIRRFRSPHPNGVIFAFEDVSDRLATMRRLNDLTSMQQEILDNLNDAVIIFGANRRLKFHNQSYLKLWNLEAEKLQDEPKLDKIISYQKTFFANVENWINFKANMLANITEGRKFNLSRDDGTSISVRPLIFYDGSLMITYSIR